MVRSRIRRGKGHDGGEVLKRSDDEQGQVRRLKDSLDVDDGGGNGLMVAAVIADRRLRTVTNTFMVSLAVSDVLIATVNMPVQLWYYTVSTMRSSSR